MSKYKHFYQDRFTGCWDLYPAGTGFASVSPGFPTFYSISPNWKNTMSLAAAATGHVLVDWDNVKQFACHTVILLRGAEILCCSTANKNPNGPRYYRDTVTLLRGAEILCCSTANKNPNGPRYYRDTVTLLWGAEILCCSTANKNPTWAPVL